MYKEKNTYDKPYRKSARAVGDVMGKYLVYGTPALQFYILPSYGLVRMDNVGSGSRKLGIFRLWTACMALARQENSVVADSISECLYAQLKRIRAIWMLKPFADFRPFIKVRAVALVAARHSVDLKELVSPFFRCNFKYFS